MGAKKLTWKRGVLVGVMIISIVVLLVSVVVWAMYSQVYASWREAVAAATGIDLSVLLIVLPLVLVSLVLGPDPRVG